MPMRSPRWKLKLEIPRFMLRRTLGLSPPSQSWARAALPEVCNLCIPVCMGLHASNPFSNNTLNLDHATKHVLHGALLKSRVSFPMSLRPKRPLLFEAVRTLPQMKPLKEPHVSVIQRQTVQYVGSSLTSSTSYSRRFRSPIIGAASGLKYVPSPQGFGSSEFPVSFGPVPQDSRASGRSASSSSADSGRTAAASWIAWKPKTPRWRAK